MTNEQLFFGLSQALRKFPKETGNCTHIYECYSRSRLLLSKLTIFFLYPDRVLCHFCFKPKKVTKEVLGIDNARSSQVLISSIILLKTALDALPLLSSVGYV